MLDADEEDETILDNLVGFIKTLKGKIDTINQAGQPPAPMPMPGAAPTGNIQENTLNGAQVTAIVDLIGQINSGSLAPDSGIAIVKSAFPTIPEDQIQAIFGSGNAAPAPA